MIIQSIVSENDRELTTGLGNWAGDATWEAGPILGREGVMRFQILAGPASKAESLQHPHVKMPAGESFLLTAMSVAIPFNATQYMSLKITIEDGTTIIGPLEPAGYAQADWNVWNVQFSTPAGWVEANGKLTLTTNNPYATERNLYLDHFSLSYEVPAKIQYLPLMGVG